MNKKGFTLIELLSAIVILGMLSTILFPIITKKISEMKEESYSTLIKTIELSAKQYVIENEEKLNQYKNNDNIYINLATLIEENYFDHELKDKRTNTIISSTSEVYITRNSKGKIDATYDINQKEKAKIELIGKYNYYIKKDSSFVDPGVTAINVSGTNVTSSIVTTGTVNTAVVGTYIRTYTYQTKSITRNVIVY